MKTQNETLAALASHQSPMGKQLRDLFETRPQKKCPLDDEYAIEAQIMLDSGATAGTISVMPSGTLRCVQEAFQGDPNIRTKPPAPILAVHYFDVYRIVFVVVIEPVKGVPVAERPSLIVT